MEIQEKMSSHSDDDSALPRASEPVCEPEVSTLEKEAEPTRCCVRARGEWQHPGLFSIQEGDKVLDIPASFGPTSWHARLIKFCLMVWFCFSLITGWYREREYAGFFLSKLTHWTAIFACLWLIISFINSLWPPTQPKKPTDPVSLWIKFSWVLFTITAPFTLVTVILYWILVYKPGETDVNYWTIFMHSCVLLVWPEGLVINRIPIRWKHLPFSIFMAACYVLWLVIHQMATDIGNPPLSDNDPETNDDLLYTAVDFQEDTVFSTVLCVMVVFVVFPLFHWLLWALSLCSFPCNCSGYNRRYISESITNRSVTPPRLDRRKMHFKKESEAILSQDGERQMAEP